MFKPYQIIRHRRAMDVAFLISKVRGPYGPNAKIVVTGEWLNMGFVESWRLGERDKIEITSRPDWEICLEPTAVCLRNARWV